MRLGKVAMVVAVAAGASSWGGLGLARAEVKPAGFETELGKVEGKVVFQSRDRRGGVPDSFPYYRDGRRYLCTLDEYGDGQDNCVKRCLNRYSDGSCARYGADFCGRGVECVPQCLSRYSDGDCAGYGPDICGRHVRCVPYCESRYSDGSCARYGRDRCSGDIQTN
ncbi:MAG: hypothetical protein HY921_01470 [Elusimicrobia bacterium]|nr:hypothetical protein [Elusimicrobiota bacterium]